MRTAWTSIAHPLLRCCRALVVAASRAPTAQQAAPVVYTAEVDGIIQPVAAEYVAHAIERADAANAALLVITLRTPGGLLDSTRDINTAIIAARTPVAVFVGPSGSRAASAGFLITMAADVAAMAPGTHIGAAHPVSGDGEQDGRDDGEEGGLRHRELRPHARGSSASATSTLVEQAVTESRSFTEQEALTAEPPLIDVVATDVPDLLRKLDGRTVTRFDGRDAGAAAGRRDAASRSR